MNRKAREENQREGRREILSAFCESFFANFAV
jgi:hypothetical protein